MIKKSISASLLISLGVYGLLKTDYSILSMILFALGLYSICYFELYLFTGKCGFLSKDIKIDFLLKILAINLISGYIIGLIFSLCGLQENAIIIVNKWNISAEYFIRSCLCGAIMYIAVYIYKHSSSIGIFFGIPLFILCGFQHSIANVIIMGTARTFNIALILCISGNWIGSLITRYLLEEK